MLRIVEARAVGERIGAVVLVRFWTYYRGMARTAFGELKRFWRLVQQDFKRSKPRCNVKEYDHSPLHTQTRCAYHSGRQRSLRGDKVISS